MLHTKFCYVLFSCSSSLLNIYPYFLYWDWPLGAITFIYTKLIPLPTAMFQTKVGYILYSHS